MEVTVKELIEKTTRELKYWQKGLKEIQEGIFKYDGSMPNSCTNGLYKNKVEINTLALEYLKTLPNKKIMQTSEGKTKECYLYYSLINSNSLEECKMKLSENK